MIWIIVGLVILYLLVISEGFRKFSGALVLICAAGGFLLWQHQNNKEEESKSKISGTELAFEDLSIQTKYGGYYLVGRVTNLSKWHTLKSANLKIIFQDCTPSGCITINEGRSYIYMRIPPKQARNIDESINISSKKLNTKGELRWFYLVTQTKAE